MEYFKFRCGCKFKTIPDSKALRIKMIQDTDVLPLNCQMAWEIIGKGDTLGLWQIESQLGRKLAQELKPENIEHLSALTAIMRPGAGESIRDGKSITQHYIDRKNGKEPVTYYHPSLEPILKDTYGEMIYQEQALEIAKTLAGLTLEEADTLRKAIGKKKPELMAKMKKLFLEGCARTNIVNKEQAEEIFSWIEKSQRYSFNKSHSVSYALISYLTAYNKAHFPKTFYCSYLQWAQLKAESETQHYDLINACKKRGIVVNPPDIRMFNQNYILYNNEIWVGITDIKGFGKSAFSKLTSVVADAEARLSKLLIDFTWIEFLIFVACKIPSNCMSALILSNGLRMFKKSRREMLFDVTSYNEMTAAATSLVESNFNSSMKDKTLIEVLQTTPFKTVTQKKVNDIINSLSNPPFSLEDSIIEIAQNEKKLIGISLTCSETDSKSTENTNCTCKDFHNGIARYVTIGVKIDEIKENIIKKEGKNKGKKMAFLKISDSSCSIDAVIFSDALDEFKDLIQKDNLVIVGGQRGKTKDSSLVIDKVWKL